GPLHVAGSVVSGPLSAVSNAEPELQSPIQNPKSQIQNPQSPNSQSLTPVLAVWTGHHPIHYFGLADHVTHFLPVGHAARMRGNAAAGIAYFREHYRHRTYQQLDRELPELVASLLPSRGAPRPRPISR